jgi:hypothetical protein
MIRAAARAWDRFFFGPVDSVAIAMFRIVFGLVALSMYSLRFTNWRAYFGDLSFIPADDALNVLVGFLRPDFMWVPPTAQAAWLANVVLIVALVFLTVGLCSRLAALVAFAAHIVLIYRNYTVCYGADFISTFFFFSLIFMQSDRVLSLRALIWGVKPWRNPSVSQILTTMGFRLLQIEMCVMYAYTGLEKMKGPAWWDGTAVWSVIGNPQLLIVDLSWLKAFPLIIAAMTFLTVLFEIYFSVLVWHPRLRHWVLLLGVGLHFGIAASVGLLFFSAVMVSSYLLFVDPQIIRRVLERLRCPATLLS